MTADLRARVRIDFYRSQFPDDLSMPAYQKFAPNRKSFQPNSLFYIERGLFCVNEDRNL